MSELFGGWDTNLKNRAKCQKPYNKLIRKIFMQTLFFLASAISVIVVLRILGRGHFANIVTGIICRVLKIDWEAGSLYYFIHIRPYMDAIIVGSALPLFAVFYKMFLSWFTKYFDEMIDGVNSLATRGEAISMSPELDFMEKTMNRIKSELEKTAEQERALEKRKSDLILYLAHDIKTPLTSIIGYLSLLEEAPCLTPAQKSQYVHITLEKSYRLEKLINEFFEIARYNLNSVPMNISRTNLSYMLAQITDEAYPQLTAAGKHVELDVPAALYLNADTEKLARVFNNLLKNAIAYSAPQSTIRISAGDEENGTAIHFCSEGEIPQDKLSVIFDKFCRLDSSRQTATGGSGLGLAIAKDIINLHGGSINAASSQGTTDIIIVIPHISMPSEENLNK